MELQFRETGECSRVMLLWNRTSSYAGTQSSSSDMGKECPLVLQTNRAALLRVVREIYLFIYLNTFEPDYPASFDLFV